MNDTVLHTDIQPTTPSLMGTTEVADYLGIGKPRVNELRHSGLLPSPLAILRFGPVWDTNSIHEFARAWERVAGNPRPEYHRYIELSYRHPSGGRRHSAVVLRAASMVDVRERAAEAIKERCPGATRVSILTQRIITTHTARKISAGIEDGTWHGWKVA